MDIRDLFKEKRDLENRIELLVSQQVERFTELTGLNVSFIDINIVEMPKRDAIGSEYVFGRVKVGLEI